MNQIQLQLVSFQQDLDLLMVFAFDKISKKWRLLLLAICTMFLLIFGAAFKLGNSSQVIAQKATNTQTNAAIYHFKIGKFKAMTVSDGNLNIPTSFFLPKADPAEVENSLDNSFLPTNSDYLFYVNVLYIDTGEHKVLIDSGAGTSFGNTAGYLAQNLQTAGIQTESIDTVLITHAHGDHIGGLVSADGNLIYPNAEYYISQAEWDFWTDPQVSLPNSLVDDKTKQSAIQGAQKILKVIENKTKFFEFGTEIIPGIIATDTSGHTPGHTSYLITSEQQKLISTGDIFYSDPLNLEHPDWEVAFDADNAKGLATRSEFLNEVSESRVELLVPHMPFPGLGHVSAEADRYAWTPSWWKFDPAG
jgi:glyoxylase-like metal-dependent hydrolase (beta-lactamase superfamily II)